MTVSPLHLPPTTTAERRTVRDVVHSGLLAAGWILMAVLWWRVLARTETQLLLLAGAFVLASLLLNVSATTLWVEHNLRIFLEKGPRQGRAAVELTYDQDWVGRTVSADWTELGVAREVVVSVDGATKRFAAAGHRATDAADAGVPDPRAA